MLLYGHDTQVALWVCQQLKLRPYPEGLYKAIGILHQNHLIGGVIWHNYHEDNWGKPLLIEVTLATVDKRWATRHNISELFQYPFRQLGVKRVQATCSRKAKRVRSTLSRLGFQFEGICREASPFGGDSAHYSILKNECFWLRGNFNGKKRTESSSSTRSSGNFSGANSIQQRNRSL